MKAIRLSKPGLIEGNPLRSEEVADPHPLEGQLLLRVLASGICHTDLHVIEGDIHPPRLPLTPGHQVVGEVTAVGAGVKGWTIGERAGVPWLHSACNTCDHCRRGDENLCRAAEFTGFNVDGGYAEAILAQADYALKVPQAIRDEDLAPLLCAGIVGYRSLHKADLQPGERLGLVGFGASAHLVIQVAVHWGHEVYVFTRSAGHQALAKQLGATWVGDAEDEAPASLDRAIIFAPVGRLVPIMLPKLRPGGTLALNAIHMTPIPEFPYRLIWEERTLRSVANATYQDGVEFLALAAEIPVRARIERYALEQANEALRDMKESRIDGAGVLIP
ncbi:MAG: zinc-dependent alcohol dehydrogenase family protein [Anaerolineae bacterium]|nr:MAG: zinc-dependent alcohol dehydrogenase family protein [Anaerolineae bacterium]